MWDGRADTLEAQSLLPSESHDELDLPISELIPKLRRQGYSTEFNAAFGRDVSKEDLAAALAAYQRTLLAADSPFDQYLFGKNGKAISESAKRGFDVFLKVKCDQCHLIMSEGLHPFALKVAFFTDNKFHNLGVGTDLAQPDPGRYAVTGVAADWAAFRTPSLRNVAVTAPYFHDGTAATLMDVVDFYERGGKRNKFLDQALVPLTLSREEKLDLVAFLESLTSKSLARYQNEESKTNSPGRH